MDKRCFGKHGLCSRNKGGNHVECLGNKAQRAAIFQDELCLPILRGLKRQLIADRRMRPGEAHIVQESDAIMLDGGDEVLLVEDRREERELPSHAVKQCAAEEGGYGLGRGHGRSSGGRTMDEVHFTPNADRYVDDLTGLPLPPDLCRAARQKELEYFKSKGVW